MDGKKPPNGPSGSSEEGAAPRRRWEAILSREEIAELLAEKRYEDLLERLRETRGRFPRDLELLRSIRVLEDHLKARSGGRE